MNRIKYILDGVECNPLNREEITYTFDFRPRQITELEISITNLEFVREDRERILNWISQNGEFLGMPLVVQYDFANVEYMLDFQADGYLKKDNSIICPIKKVYSNDNLFENLNALSFDVLNWNAGDFREVSYEVVEQDQFAKFLSTSIAFYILAKELAESIERIQDGVTDLIEATVPVGAPIPGPNWGAIIVASIKLAGRIAYTIAIFIALIKLGQQIIEIIFPIIRKFKCATVKRLIEKGCEYHGFTLKSNLLDSLSDLVLIPVPLRPNNVPYWKELFFPNSLAFNNGHPSLRDSINSVGQLVTVIENTFNAKSRVVGNELIIERKTFFNQNAVQNIVLSKVFQDEIQNGNGLNSNEKFKRIYCKYAIDSSDFNTLDDTSKGLSEYSSEVINSIGVNYELIKGLDAIEIPFATASLKGELSFIQKQAKKLAGLIDSLTGSNLKAKIDNLKNVMVISQQYFSVTKLAYLQGDKLNPNQKDLIGADVIINNYHSDRFIENNNKKIYTNVEVAQTQKEMYELLNNNFVILESGEVAEVLLLEWSEETHVSTIDFAVLDTSVNVQTIQING